MSRFVRRRDTAAIGGRRRSGPVGEDRWWDSSDQELAERAAVGRRIFGPRWIDAPMVNNVERLRPYGSDEASSSIEEQRRSRRPTALDEGRAWRHRDTRALLVVRVEVFAEADDRAHRAAWVHDGAASLDATWRERWRERDQTPGWIEAVAVGTGERPDPLHAFAQAEPTGVAAAIDWFRVEDHTDLTGARDVLLYEHLTVWAGRAHGVLVVRHDLGQSVDRAVAQAAAVFHARLLGPDPP